MTRVIRFYRVDDEYGCFSNFTPYPIEIAARTWPTSEHYFQAQKFAGTEHEVAVRSAGSPMEAARMGRDRGRPLRPDWEAVKDDVMREAVRAKFRHTPNSAPLCLRRGTRSSSSTPKTTLTGATAGTAAAGTCSGASLVEVREELRGTSL